MGRGWFTWLDCGCPFDKDECMLGMEPFPFGMGGLPAGIAGGPPFDWLDCCAAF